MLGIVTRKTMKPSNEFLIGIDGGKNTGVAVYHARDEKFLSISTLDFWRAYTFITEMYSPETATIIIEKLNSTGALYARTFSATRGGRDRFAANVGSARRETDLLIEGLELAGFTVARVNPVRAAKWTAQDLARFCNWTSATSEHGRDAARIIFYS